MTQAPAVVGSKREAPYDEMLVDAKRQASDALQGVMQQGADGTPSAPQRICFPFMNRGFCSYGQSCKYRHLPPDHPDAIADRSRLGTANASTALQHGQGQGQTSGVVKICFPFLNKGSCERGDACRFRHLAQDHPDAVADRMRAGAYSKIPVHVNPLIDQNPRAVKGETRICYAFLNRGACDRPECTFRHLLSGHPDAIADHVRNGKLSKIPDYAREAVGAGAHMAMGAGAQIATGAGAQMGMGAGAQMGMGAGAQMGMGAGAQMGMGAGAQMGMGAGAQMGMGAGAQMGAAAQFGGPSMDMGGLVAAAASSAASAAASSGVSIEQMPMVLSDPTFQLQIMQQLLMQQMQQAGQAGQMQQAAMATPGSGTPMTTPGSNSVAPGETRICFPFLNKGRCDRGMACKFRHLAPDHPDAIADRQRSGKLAPQAAQPAAAAPVDSSLDSAVQAAVAAAASLAGQASYAGGHGVHGYGGF